MVLDSLNTTPQVERVKSLMNIEEEAICSLEYQMNEREARLKQLKEQLASLEEI